MSAPLLDAVVLSDGKSEAAQVSVSAQSSKLSLIWVTGDMIMHVILSSSFAAFVYVSHSYFGYPLSTGAFLGPHTLLGAILGIALTIRVFLGLQRVSAASKSVQDFAKTCRQMAVLSTFVKESMTISAGAEAEKMAVRNFRYELVRLLNLSFYSFTLSLSDNKMCVPPTALKAKEGGKLEQDILANPDTNPTVMVSQMIAKLISEQVVAKRIANEQASVLMNKSSDMLDAYHQSVALRLAPPPYSLSSFCYFFCCFFIYSLGPLIAFNELGDNLEFATLGLTLTVFYTFILSNFFFGLYEAGKKLEIPIKEMAAMVAPDEIGFDLSDDLSSLVGDALVPSFVKRAAN